MTEYKKLTFPSLMKESFSRNSDKQAMSFVGEDPITYAEVAEKVDAVISFLEKIGVKPGNKVAILSSNMPNWGISYFAITFMGAVVVPLLPDFLRAEIHNVLLHSETEVILVSPNLAAKLDNLEIPLLRFVIRIEDFTVLSPKNSLIRFESMAKPVHHYQVNEHDLAAIIYTSGTMGKPKGVMLTQKNITYTALKGMVIQPISQGDRFLSVLPLSHTYENTLGLVLPLLGGASIHYLRKPPTPSILLPAVELVKPTMMLTVPLIIEKIYFNRILPLINSKFITRNLYKVAYFRKKLNRVAGKKLMKTFGNEMRFFGIGGAKLNGIVENFLREARFPYAIGYGMTEASPLIAGTGPSISRWQCTGPPMEGVEIKIVDPEIETGRGEVWAKGPNIMLGYYKDPEQTAETITTDGWLRTGDLGTIDQDGYLAINGRLKNMILGSSGENIYPEEIESVINNFRYVVESLVVEQKGKLVALVHFNKEEIEQRYQFLKDEVANYVEQKIEELRMELQEYVNSRVNRFSQVQLVIALPDPFNKTATQKIKRFMYTS